MTTSTPKANRIHIGFFGRCNAGKSTLINMLTDQPVSLVSEVSGTTTDPVSKAMEILPLGPVVITDTAGVDDTSILGTLRVEKTKEIIKKINLAVYVLRSDKAPTAEDYVWLEELNKQNLPVAILVNEISYNHHGDDVQLKYRFDIDEYVNSKGLHPKDFYENLVKETFNLTNLISININNG